MKSEKLLTQGEILQNKVFSGPQIAYQQAEEVSEAHKHDRILSKRVAHRLAPRH